MSKRAASTRAKERANISFFIFVMFFVVFGVIVLTEFLMLEKASGGAHRAKLLDDVQSWREMNKDTFEPQGGFIKRKRRFYTPAKEPLDAVWQAVETLAPYDFSFFVYSAYLDTRFTPSIRIIAATRTRGHGSFWCQLHLSNNRTQMMQAHIRTIRENWNLKYSATYVICHLGSEIPLNDVLEGSVSVVPVSNDRPPNLLKILETRKNSTKCDNCEAKIYVCVKPFHFSYNRVPWLIEWLELQRLLGVNHFIMFEESLGPAARCALKYYERAGSVTLLPWRLNITSIKKIRNQGQFAAFNDCLYRSMHTADWLIPLDVDEVIFPRKEGSLQKMMAALEDPKRNRKLSSAYIFRNAFFYMSWPNDRTRYKSKFTTMKKTRRWAVPHAYKTRSKFAVKPQDAVELGNHFVWEMVPGKSSIGVPMDEGLLHHYRSNCEFGGNDCTKVNSVIDRTAHRWEQQLEYRMRIVNEQLYKECQSLITTTSRVCHRLEAKFNSELPKDLAGLSTSPIMLNTPTKMPNNTIGSSETFYTTNFFPLLIK